MRTIGIIPSRFASTRLPGKPLEMIGRKSLIMRVYEQAMKVGKLSDVYVATDDERIKSHVQEHGGKVIMTSTEHNTGTERCFEAIEKLQADCDFVLNIQGDEPFIHPEQLDQLIASISHGDEILTLCKKIDQHEDLIDPNLPKVVMGNEGMAMYFSRSPVPFLRGVDIEDWISKEKYFKHIGIYLYRKDILATIVQQAPSIIEVMEQLEQLRWMSNGIKIKAVKTSHDSISVDTPEDLQKARAYVESDKSV